MKIVDKMRPGKTAPAKGKAPEEVRNLGDTAKDVFVKLRDAEASAIHKRLAKQALPWGVGAAVAGSALLGIRPPEPATFITAGIADAAIVAGLYIPKALNLSFVSAVARWARDNPAHTILCGVAAWVWFTAAVILGFDFGPELAVAGLVGLYVMSARWWNAHRIGYPGDDVVAEVAEGIEELAEAVEEVFDELFDRDEIMEKWDSVIARNNGVLSGSRLADPEDHPAGTAYLLYLVPGRQTLDDVMNAMSRIATALGVPQRNLLVEDRQPTEDDPDPDPAILKFQVITRSPIRKTVPLEGPRWRWNGNDLIIDLGPFADGIGQAPWRLYSENSLWGGVVCGTQGSGKSSLIDAMAISFLDTGFISIIYVDPQNGGSSPALFEHAAWAIGDDPDQQEALLVGLESLVNFRGMENSVRLGVSGFTMTPSRPGIVVIVDECHKVFTVPNAKRWGLVARMGRKVGVAIVAASQIYGLDSFGGEDSLRQSLESANSAILRIGRNQASLIPGTTLDPSRLPHIPGYGVIREVDPTYNRSAPFRGPYAKDAVRMAMMAAAARKQPELDRIAIGALDNETNGAYSNRHISLEESKARMEDELRQLEAGLTVAVPKTVVSSGPMGPDLEQMIREYEESVSEHGLTGIKKVIYEGVLSGVLDTASLWDLAESRGFKSESWFYVSLKELQDADLIRRGAKTGVYEKGAA